LHADRFRLTPLLPRATIPAVEGDTPRDRFVMAAACVAVVAVAALPFLPFLDAPFLHDDVKAVVENPLVTGPFDPARIVASNAWGSPREYRHIPNYRPLSVATLSATHAVAGLDPVPYRATGIALQAAASLLVLALALRLGASRLAAGLAAAWFAAHPVHVETVMFVVNREEAMASIAVLSALLVLAVPPPAGWKRVAGASGLLAMGVLSKETAVVLPAMALLRPLADAPGHTGRRWPDVRAFLALTAVVAAYFVLRFAVFGRFMGGPIPWQDNPLARADLAGRLAGALAVLAEAGRLLVAPSGLTVDYGFDVLGLPADGFPMGAVAGIALAVAGLAAIGLARRRAPLVGHGLLLAAVAWAPFSSLLVPSSIILAERSLYLPSAGIALALAGCIDLASSALARPPAGLATRLPAIAACAWIAAFLAGSAGRAADFRSGVSLFASSLANRPGSTRLHDNLGVALQAEGRLADAEREFRRALAIDPDNADAHNNLATVHQARGELRAAAAEYTEALRLRPGMLHAEANLCTLLARAGDFESAAPWCDRAASRGADVAWALERLASEGSCVAR
jgi:tetratricopeptide (TPR) repeat protein